jgi:hypothetical protein
MNKIQELQLEQLRYFKFHNICGKWIVADLLNHQSLWSAVFVEFHWHIDKKKNPDPFWIPWSIFLFPKPAAENALRHVAESWKPDVVQYFCEEGTWRSLRDGPHIFFDVESLNNPKLFIEVYWTGVPTLIQEDDDPFSLHLNKEG